MNTGDEAEAVKRAAEKKGANVDFLLAILRTYQDNVDKGKKLQATQAIESLVEEEVARRVAK